MTQELTNSNPYIIEINGKVVSAINPFLARNQGVDNEKSLKVLRDLHTKRIAMEKALIENDDKNTLDDIKKFLEDWKEIQFQLQAAWKFPQDENYHRFFDIAGCSCSYDQEVSAHNRSRYPNGGYLYSHKCYVHRHLAKD